MPVVLKIFIILFFSGLLFANDDGGIYSLLPKFGCKNIHESTDIDEIKLDWQKIKYKCSQIDSISFYDNDSESVGFCRSMHNTKGKDNIFLTDDAIIEKLNIVCNDYQKGNAIMYSFSNDCDLNLARVRCQMSKDEIQKFEDEKMKIKNKEKIKHLKSECLNLGFKDGTDDFKKCVMELL